MDNGAVIPALHNMKPPGIDPLALASVLPRHHGTPVWEGWLEPLIKVAKERNQSDPHAWADGYLRRNADAVDLRALGFCRECGGAITLRQVGKSVYSVPCDHYRAQGVLLKMRPHYAEALRRMSDERRRCLLALIGRDPTGARIGES